jgi:hypothetical protein
MTEQKGYILRVGMPTKAEVDNVLKSIERLGPDISCTILPSATDPCVLHVVVEQIRRDAKPLPVGIFNAN